MKISTTTLKTESVSFKTIPDALKAIQNTKTLTTDIREITNSSEFQTLLRHLNTLERPFGICIVRAKEVQ